ncbi:hypothetical protein [Salipiger abyssi]|uniref:Lipoprotein n=1 Tax=Salipiger abyssi TaxID=1250539 RepID=A0A1P8UR49_9RHOB|nr:hypothetical protein [Salipiger abyssi]APZ51900.1 hypothetical protein Ga0080574_TMP1566 [Salipiger abyssi]
MTLPRFFAALLLLVATLAVGGCAGTPAHELQPPSETEIAALAQEIRSLGPEIAPEEASRAARVSLEYPLRLAQAYEIEDAPYIHNIKVNQGLKPRGLCYQWADDLEARLRQEGFTTLKLHRAIANSESALRIEHSTVIVSAPGDGMYEGIVLDPWRNGGKLYWGPVREDTRYPWLPRQEVFARKRLQRQAAR